MDGWIWIQEFLKDFTIAGWVRSKEIADNSLEFVDEFSQNCLSDGIFHYDKPFDFCGDPDHDPDPEILREFLSQGGCENFVGSAVLVEVCGL